MAAGGEADGAEDGQAKCALRLDSALQVISLLQCTPICIHRLALEVNSDRRVTRGRHQRLCKTGMIIASRWKQRAKWGSVYLLGWPRGQRV